MPKIATYQLVQGQFGLAPARVTQPSTADPEKTIEVDGFLFFWTDGMETFHIMSDLDTLAILEEQIGMVRKNLTEIQDAEEEQQLDNVLAFPKS